MQKLSTEIIIEQLTTALSSCQEQLQEIRQENDAFINIAAHDLKAPLRKLATLVDRFLQKATKIESEALQVYSDKIFNAITEMNSLVERLSAYAAVETDGIKFTETALSALIKEVIEENTSLINANNATIIFNELPALKINKPQVKTVFKELLDNAIKFKSEEEKPHIEIKSYFLSLKDKEIYNLASEKIYYKFEFIDNGIGISEALKEKIFQPFFRFHGNAGFAGSGMGLAICRKIMKNHCGFIYSVANEKNGVRMIVIFPETL